MQNLIVEPKAIEVDTNEVNTMDPTLHVPPYTSTHTYEKDIQETR